MIKYKIKRKIVNGEKMESVTSHDLYPLPCHKLSHFLRPPPPLERDILYGRPQTSPRGWAPVDSKGMRPETLAVHFPSN